MMIQQLAVFLYFTAILGWLAGCSSGTVGLTDSGLSEDGLQVEQSIDELSVDAADSYLLDDGLQIEQSTDELSIDDADSVLLDDELQFEQPIDEHSVDDANQDIEEIQFCGALDQPCCSESKCNSELTCISGSCVVQNTGPTPTLITTFHSMSVYWQPSDGSSSRAGIVQYRASGSNTWRDGLDLWFDDGEGIYKGSLVHLNPGTAYEVRLSVGGTSTVSMASAATWSENFPVSQTNTVSDGTSTYTVSQSGFFDINTNRCTQYVKYVPDSSAPANIDVQNSSDYDIIVNAYCVIISGFKLTGGRDGGIYLSSDVHDVVIEGCEIWNWGSGNNFEGAVFGGDNYSKLNPAMKRIIIQRNKIYNPRSGSNDWGSGHPSGPQAVVLFNSGGNHVIRYNHAYSDSYDHYYNDVFGAGANEDVGFPGADSDIYGNHLGNCWDDAIESDGYNVNVRIWGNYLHHCYVGISDAAVIKGPLYIWRNVIGITERGPGDSSNAQGLVKTGDVGGVSTTGRAYIFHNTTLQPNGVGAGLCNGPAINAVSRNNIFELQSSTRNVFSSSTSTTNDFDYDLYNGILSAAYPGAEPNGIHGVPIYMIGASLETGYFLISSSLGYDQGVRINNFNDDNTGSAPDMGAYESETAPLEFGVDAFSNFSSYNPSFH